MWVAVASDDSANNSSAAESTLSERALLVKSQRSPARNALACGPLIAKQYHHKEETGIEPATIERPAV